MRVNESGGVWSVVDPCCSVMEGSGGVSVECAWEPPTTPAVSCWWWLMWEAELVLGLCHGSGLLLNCTVWEDRHVINTDPVELL